MKLLVHPYNPEQRLVILIAIEVNREKNVLNWYHQTNYLTNWKPKSDRDPRFCIATRTIDDAIDFVLPPLKEKFKMGKIEEITENHPDHIHFHSSNNDKETLLHLHFRFENPLSEAFLREMVLALYNFQNTLLLGKPDRVLLLPPGENHLKNITKALTSGFSRASYDKSVKQVNCVQRRETPFHVHAPSFWPLPETETTPLIPAPPLCIQNSWGKGAVNIKQFNLYIQPQFPADVLEEDCKFIHPLSRLFSTPQAILAFAIYLLLVTAFLTLTGKIISEKTPPAEKATTKLKNT